MQKCIGVRLFHAAVFCAFICALPVGARAQPAPAPDGTGFALLVDISDYRDTNIPPLRWESREVDRIKSALRSVAGFPEQQIYVVTGENATREGITEALTAVVERARTQANARFLFHLKGRSLRAQGKNYFLPYDARVGAISTYIEETTLANWFDGVPLRVKALIQATWATDDQGDQAFSSQLAEILRDEGVDGDRDRKVTLAEMGTKIRELGFRGDYPIHITGDGAIVLIRLLSALEVASQPPGATILLDDTEKDVTPARLVGLTPGTHRLRVKKDLYRMSEEQTIEIASARGQRVISPSYQLTPISVYGTALNVDKKVVDGAEVHIVGTEYRQNIDNEGKFSFEDWQAYGLLASGKTYEMVARSPDGLYEGSASFTFSGTEDIRLAISLTQTNWVGLAAQRLAGGDRAGAVALLDAKLETSGRKEGDSLLGDETLNDITPALALAFLTHLEGKLQTEPDNLQWRVAAAQLADLNGDTSAARRHWKTVKANASKETGEYKQAVARLKETAPIGLGGLLALTVILLFDEFGAITGSENFDTAFFSFLRSIANNHECAYVTTSRAKLQKLCRDTDISESPFFNIFTPVPLGQFDRDEARSLIFTPSTQAGVPFDERDAEFVLSVAGHHPLFIQMACAALFDYKSGDGASPGAEARLQSGKIDFEAVKADFLVEATEQFEQIWQDADEGKREVLCQVAVGGDITNQQRYLIRELQRAGYLTDAPPAPFSQAFAEFLVSKHPDTDVGKAASQIPRQPVKRSSFSSRIKSFFRRGSGKG